MRQTRVGGGLCAAPLLTVITALCLLLSGCSGLPAAREMVRLQGVYRDAIPPEKEDPIL